METEPDPISRLFLLLPPSLSPNFVAIPSNVTVSLPSSISISLSLSSLGENTKNEILYPDDFNRSGVGNEVGARRK